MDDKLFGQVDNEKLYKVLSFIFFSLTPTLKKSSTKVDSFHLSIRARCLSNTIVHIVKRMVLYINTMSKPNGRETYKQLDELYGSEECL